MDDLKQDDWQYISDLLEKDATNIRTYLSPPHQRVAASRNQEIATKVTARLSANSVAVGTDEQATPIGTHDEQATP